MKRIVRLVIPTAIAGFLLVVALAIAQTPQTSISTNGPNAWGIDFCSDHSLQRVVVPINQAAAGPTTLLTGVPGKQWFVCYLFLSEGVSTGAQNAGLVEGTGTNCSSVSAGMMGGTTAATQPNLSPDENFHIGNGAGTMMVTATAGDNVCLVMSGALQMSGVLVAVNR